MAGGSYPDPRLGASIGERLGWATAERATASAARTRPAARSPDAGAQHCWVVGLPGLPDRIPGLLLEWEQHGRGWSGLVLVAVPGTLGTLMRLPADHLRPLSVSGGGVSDAR